MGVLDGVHGRSYRIGKRQHPIGKPDDGQSREVTGENVTPPSLSVSVISLHYSDTHRLLADHVKPKNVGKVPIRLHSGTGDMWVKIKQLPADAKDGPMDLDEVPVSFEKLHMLNRYLGNDGEYNLDPGAEFDEVATFIVPVGIYSIEAQIAYPSGNPSLNTVGDQEIANVP